MSDFFTRLAERTLGLALTIQPITPSLFAPEPDLTGDMLLEITEERIAGNNFRRNTESPVPAQDATTHLTHPNLPTAASVQHEVSPSFSTTPATLAVQQSEGVHSALADQQAARNPERLTIRNEVPAAQRGSRQARPVTSAPPVLPASSAYAHITSIAPVTAQTVPIAQRISEDTKPTTPFPASPATGSSFTHISTAQATSEQQLAQVQQTTRAATAHKQIVSQHTLVGVPAPNPPSTTGFSQIQQVQQAQIETISPEPAIQVTIGRVEVRAVTAPPTRTRTQQQSDRPPAMSLDEYLRQQERGGRR